MKDLLAYQHVFFLMGKTKEDFEAMDLWDEEDDEIADEAKKPREEANRVTFDWNSEFPEMYQDGLRLCIRQLEEYLERFYASYNRNIEKGLTFRERNLLSLLFWDQPEDVQTKIKKLKSNLYFSEHKVDISVGRITSEMIIKARDYPFTNLVKLDSRNFCKCPFHNEKTPSFYVKKNFGYCFGCGKSCDTIEYVMTTKNKSFPDAVRSLQ